MVQSPVRASGTDQAQKTTSQFAIQDHAEDTARVSPRTNLSLFLALTIGSLGIIFGDIGTSPLYVLPTTFADNKHPTPSQCTGVVSLIIWNLIILVTIKYAVFILMADHRGEGGTFALCALLTGENSKLRARAKHAVSIISILAASLLIGDGALTPAISVLSAIEGIATTSPNMTKWIVPITIVIIILLFLVQMFGTAKIGLTFAPIMIVWFATLFSIGVWRTTSNPSILHAFNPWEAISYLIREKSTGFYQMGGVFLSVTGLEALYADLGHFGRWPVRTSWLFVVLPSVIANYLGQGALIMTRPDLIDSSFYSAGPEWARWPLIVLATLATIIASQAIITGVFSLVSQAASLGYSPPLRVIHTSQEMIGQIYVPSINWILMALTLAITLFFQSSTHLSHAYGVTVSSVMLMTTILYMCVMRDVWKQNWMLVALFGLFLITDGYFFAANAIKFLQGAWVAVLIAFGFFVIGFCWHYGQTELRRHLHIHTQTTALTQLKQRFGANSNESLVTAPEDDRVERCKSLSLEMQLASSDEDTEPQTADPKVNILPPINNENGPLGRQISFINNIEDAAFYSSASRNIVCTTTPGLGVFLTTSSKHTPHIFERVLTYIHAFPQVAIFLKIEYARIPIVDSSLRLKMRIYGSAQRRIYHITARYGYSEHKIRLLDILQLAATEHNVPIPEDRDITFYVPAISVQVKRKGWRAVFSRPALLIYSLMKNIFPFGQKNLQISPDHTVRVGMVVPL